MEQNKEQIPYRSQCKCYCHTTNGPALHFVPCCQPDPTIEEVLARHWASYLSKGDTNIHSYTKAFANEWASLQTEQLRQENIQLHDKLQEWISKDASQFNELKQLKKSFHDLHGESRILRGELQQLRQENKTLKEQQRTLHVEVNSDSLAVAHYEKEIEQLRQDIRDLVFQNSSLQGYCQELEQKVEQLTKRCNQESERVVQAEQRARDWQEQCHNYTKKLM